MTDGRLDVAQINGMSQAEFVEALGGVFEHSPWVAAEVWAARPLASADGLHKAMMETVRGAPDEEKLRLLRAHPDLAGKAARIGTMTADSRSEQSRAGLDHLSDAEYERFNRLNSAYREKFDFPFIIAVRNLTLESILAAFEERLGQTIEHEIEAALGEIGVITRLRLNALIGEPADA
ncbi:MAG: 2-oxo-4-hydroxy-4-carboxy-5-ureidoimidazoline decarboxylase [Rhodospirillales bacterium]|nr:2-oxo-4-hydroxy-4-carboxy-5-ureidoimidazoline decarboxylase [Rhodospirillales bacterium]